MHNRWKHKYRIIQNTIEAYDGEGKDAATKTYVATISIKMVF